MAGIVIGFTVFLLLLFARQLIQLLFLLGLLTMQLSLLLIVHGPYAKTRYALLFGLVLVGSVLWHLYLARPV